MMPPRASLVRRPLPRQEGRPASVSAIMPALRDFSQPWLDLNDKSVLVTGGTGSFGKHFLKTVIAQYKPRRLIIFSRDELKQFEMAQDFPPEKYPFIRYFIGDVRDRDRLDLALRDVDYVDPCRGDEAGDRRRNTIPSNASAPMCSGRRMW